jgi:hypothetical protein
MRSASIRRVLVIVLAAAAVVPMRAQDSIVGVWQRVFLDDKGQPTQDPSPLLVVYTDVGVYMQVSFRLDRQDSRPLAELNADELRARFSGTSAQHGTYSVAGNRLTRRIVGSFTPINQGREFVNYVKIQGDTFIMGDETIEKADVAAARIQFRRVKKAP